MLDSYLQDSALDTCLPWASCFLLGLLQTDPSDYFIMFTEREREKRRNYILDNNLWNNTKTTRAIRSSPERVPSPILRYKNIFASCTAVTSAVLFCVSSYGKFSIFSTNFSTFLKLNWFAKLERFSCRLEQLRISISCLKAPSFWLSNSEEI